VAAFAYAIVGGPSLVTRLSYAVTKGQNMAGREQLLTLAKQDTLSPLFAEVARVVRPSVVEVRVTKRITSDMMPEMEQFFQGFQGGRNNPFLGPFEHNWSPGQNTPRKFVQRGLGSGVIVDAGNGYVLTNYHVIASADETQVILHDGRTLKSEWIRSDPQSDLAIIKVKPEGLTEAPLGNSDEMKIGDWVLAFGAPEGFSQTVTAGIISASGRTTGEANAYQNFLQTDAAINHGNSGGPLVNMKGEVIGINTAIVSQSGGNEGIGLAIPSSMVRNVMSQLIEKGKVTRGYLGVTIQNVDEGLAKSFKLPDTRGALVSSVAAESPAIKAGLKEGDFIVAISGMAVGDVNELRNAVAGIEPGKTVGLEYYRGGVKASANITIEAQPATMLGMAPTTQPAESATNKLGLEVATMSQELADQFGYKSTVPKGVVITLVTPGSPADAEGLKQGMVITEVQDQAVLTADQFRSALSKEETAGGLRLRVTDPSGGARFVFLTPEK
jgi:serine protease Do